MKKKGTSTKKPKKVNKGVDKPVQLDPNEELSQFVKEKNIDFQVSVFEDKYVYVPGKGFLFFDKPQLIYKARRK